MDGSEQRAGLREALLTGRLEQALEALAPSVLEPELAELSDGEASDRISRHVARLLAQAIDAAPERERTSEGIRLAREVLQRLSAVAKPADLSLDIPSEPGQVLYALLTTRPDGSLEPIERPLTPLLDTTVFTNAPGEPTVGHELRAEVDSAESIDVVMAFIRFSGVRPLLEVIQRHCQRGKSVRILTTTYTNSTEQRALDELTARGAEVRVSYDTSDDAVACQSVDLPSSRGLLHRVCGFIQPDAFRPGDRSRVEREALRCPQSRCASQDCCGLRQLLGKPRLRWSMTHGEFRLQTAIEDGGDLIRLSPLEIEPPTVPGAAARVVGDLAPTGSHAEPPRCCNWDWKDGYGRRGLRAA